MEFILEITISAEERMKTPLQTIKMALQQSWLLEKLIQAMQATAFNMYSFIQKVKAPNPTQKAASPYHPNGQSKSKISWIVIPMTPRSTSISTKKIFHLQNLWNILTA